METKWQHDTLLALVSGLDQLADEKTGLLKKVQDRLDFAASIEKRSIEDYRVAWNEAIASIADENQCPIYQGLVMKPLMGFVPLGRDPQSGLWEFAHLQTGVIPERDADGRLQFNEESGLVFVLVPWGVFRMGSEQPSDNHPVGSPNVDPDAQAEESPVHEVEVQPFLLSKYEMNQGQWVRFTGNNPSHYRPGMKHAGLELTPLHPIEQVSWEASFETLAKLKLRLPTEPEWEYAARAGTATVFWTGNEKESLNGTINLADLFLKNNGGPPNLSYEDWMDDGYTIHAPVGTYIPNPFGFHDILGNVWEWCHDLYSYYENKEAESSAQTQSASYRITRGGCWGNSAYYFRSAYRARHDPEFLNIYLGLRPAADLNQQ